MADSTVPLNSGTGGKTLDTESLVGAGSVTVERQRLQITGSALLEVSRVLNSAPAGTEYALVVRPIAPATQVVSQSTASSLNATVAQSTAANLNATVVQATAANLNTTALLTTMAAATSNPTGVVSLGNSLGKTNVMKTGTLSSSATTADQVILTYTVTTGKTFYVTYLKWQARLTTYAATATNFGPISLELPSGTKVITEEIFNAGIDGCYILQFPEPVPVASTTVIRVVCTPSAATAFKWAASFGGYEK